MKKPASPPQPFACATARAASGWAAPLGEPESSALAAFSPLLFLPFASLPFASLPFACLPADFCGAVGGAATGVAASLVGGCSRRACASVAIALIGFQHTPPLGAFALEDEAHQTATIAVAHLAEGYGTTPAGIVTHDPTHPHNLLAIRGQSQLELDLLVDLQHMRAGEQQAPA